MTHINDIDVSSIQPLLENFNFAPIVKLVVIAILMVYLIVALVVIKQIGLMTRTIRSKSNVYIFLLSYFHLFAVAVTLLFALIAL